MASSDLREELDCSICLNIYTDPVMLKCGHNFCQDCIDQVFDSQEGSEGFSCPQCRVEFRERPSPHRNITLRNITQRFLSASPEPEKSGIFCTYCIHTSVPAVKSCLLCEASLCDDHLKVHSKSPEHVICDPTSTSEDRKCSVHNTILEYYCTEDSACICVCCSLTGEHRGHQVETLEEASTKKKKKLISNLQKLVTKRLKTERRVWGLQAHKVRVQKKADVKAERVSALFRELRKRLENLEEKVLDEVSRQAERILSPVNDLIQRFELMMEKMSRKIRPLEELCATTDPLTVLQEPDAGDLGETEDEDDDFADAERGRKEKLTWDLDMNEVSYVLHAGFPDVISGLISGIYIPKAVNMFLDEDTAHNNVLISSNKRSASKVGNDLNRPDNEERFVDYYQVFADLSFSSGRHYWEVYVQQSNNWIIGMAYDSIYRDKGDSIIGRNDVSWGLDRKGRKYIAVHDDHETDIYVSTPVKRVRVYLDYEAGQISFYTCDPLCHLHTFTATFTEPLYAVLGVCHSYISLD